MFDIYTAYCIITHITKHNYHITEGSFIVPHSTSIYIYGFQHGVITFFIYYIKKTKIYYLLLLYYYSRKTQIYFLFVSFLPFVSEDFPDSEADLPLPKNFPKILLKLLGSSSTYPLSA